MLNTNKYEFDFIEQKLIIVFIMYIFQHNKYYRISLQHSKEIEHLMEMHKGKKREDIHLKFDWVKGKGTVKLGITVKHYILPNAIKTGQF